MARLYVRLLESLGFSVAIASPLRTFSAHPGPAADAALCAQARSEVARILAAERSHAEPARFVFCYHLFPKAPDLVGPALAAGLGVPYLVAEAARVPKYAAGPFAARNARSEAAIDQAAIVFVSTARDRVMLEARKPASQYLVDLKPFLDLDRWRESLGAARAPRRVPRLLTVAMMREGDKFASYEILALALRRLTDVPFTLDIVGDGPARPAVEALFAAEASRVRFCGLIDNPRQLGDLYAQADLFAWPAVNEAFGMVFLEAQAHGLPCLAGNDGGVADVIRDGVTGRLVPRGDASAFAEAMGDLVRKPAELAALGRAARRFVAEERGLDGAARIMRSALQTIGIRVPPGRTGRDA